MMLKTRRKRRILAASLACALLALGIGWAAPALIHQHLDHVFAHVISHDYRAHVRDVHLRPLDLGIAFDLRIEHVADARAPAFFATHEVLIHAVRGTGRVPQLEMRYLSPEIHVIDAQDEQRAQLGPKMDLAYLNQSLPLALMRVTLINGTIHVHNFSGTPKVNLVTRNVNVVLDRLTQCLPPSGECDALLDVRASVLGRAPLVANGRLQHDQDWRFDVNTRLERLPIAGLNAALLRYADIDVKKGSLSLKAALHQRNDKFEGFVRPYLRDVDVLSAPKPQTRFFRELAAGIAAHYLERHSGEITIRFSGTQGKDDLHTRLDFGDATQPTATAHVDE